MIHCTFMTYERDIVFAHGDIVYATDVRIYLKKGQLMELALNRNSEAGTKMVTGVNQKLYHRAVNNGNAESPQPVLPTTNVASPIEKAQARRQTKTRGELVSKRSMLILVVGIMLGCVVPIFLVETNFMPGLDKIEKKEAAMDRILTAEDITSRLMENKKLLSSQSLPTDRSPQIMFTKNLSDHRRMKILVTGGAGFVGSHLVDKLMQEGHEVTVVDNFFTGQKKNVAHWMHHPNFRYVEYLRRISV